MCHSPGCTALPSSEPLAAATAALLQGNDVAWPLLWPTPLLQGSGTVGGLGTVKSYLGLAMAVG